MFAKWLDIVRNTQALASRAHAAPTSTSNVGVLVPEAVEVIVPPVAKGARPPLILPLRLPRFRFCVLWKEKKTDFHREIELYEDTKCLRR